MLLMPESLKHNHPASVALHSVRTRVFDTDNAAGQMLLAVYGVRRYELGKASLETAAID